MGPPTKEESAPAKGAPRTGQAMDDRGKRTAREGYVEAAKAARAALRRARSAKVRKLDRDVLDGLIELIPLYSRLADEIGTRQLAGIVYAIDAEKVSGHQRDRVRLSLLRLAAAGVVDVDFNRGRYARSVVSFPPDQSSTPEQDSRGQSSAGEQDCEIQSCADASSILREREVNPAQWVGHSGKYSGKVSEKNTRDRVHVDEHDDDCECRDCETRYVQGMLADGETENNASVLVEYFAKVNPAALRDERMSVETLAQLLFDRGYFADDVARLLPGCKWFSHVEKRAPVSGPETADDRAARALRQKIANTERVSLADAAPPPFDSGPDAMAKARRRVPA